MSEPFSPREFDSVVQPCPLKAAKEALHWIEIELLGEDDQGIPYEPFLLCLPDGLEVKGFLDAQGLARLDGLKNPGQCRLSFPARDKDAWHDLASSPTDGRSA